MGVGRRDIVGSYYFNRIVSAVITIILIATLTFAMMHSIPGGPFTRERPVPDEILRALNEKYNLDAPLYEQYFDYMKGLFTFNLGPSYSKIGTTVNELLAGGFPASGKIGLMASILIIVIGIPVGIISALKQNKPIDYFVMFMATLGVTVPSFGIATLIIYVFAGKLGWLPSFGISSPLGYIGPVIALTGYSLSFVSRLTRSSMLEVLRQDYIRTARAKGLKEKRVINYHAFRNTLIPVVTILGGTLPSLFAGSLITETLFGIVGIGKVSYDAMLVGDIPFAMFYMIFMAALTLIGTLIADIMYAVVDPRVRVAR